MQFSVDSIITALLAKLDLIQNSKVKQIIAAKNDKGIDLGHDVT